MLRRLRTLDGFGVEATDGRAGRVVSCVFDDATWRVRYFVADAPSGAALVHAEDVGRVVWTEGRGAAPRDGDALCAAAGRLLACEATRGERLHGSDEVCGYVVQAIDGDVGRVVGFVLDDATWAIRYLVVEADAGRRVLVAADDVDHVNRAERRVVVCLLKRAVATAPPDEDDAPSVTPELARRLADHFARPANWR